MLKQSLEQFGIRNELSTTSFTGLRHDRGHPELRRLLEFSVFRVVKKASRRPSEPFTHTWPVFGLGHVVDWLWAALVNEAPWLRNIKIVEDVGSDVLNWFMTPPVEDDGIFLFGATI
jgi:hypothetical protein